MALSIFEDLMRAFAGSARNPVQARLKGVVDDAIKRHGNTDKGVDSVMRAIDDDPALMVELLDQIKFRRALVTRFVRARAGDLQSDDTQTVDVSRTQQGSQEPLSGGRSLDGTRPPSASAQKQPAQPKQSRQNKQTTSAFKPRTKATPKPQTSKLVGKNASPSATMQRCVLDMLRINGQKLRDVTPDEALQQAERWHIEAGKVERVCTGLAPNVKVGAQLSDDEANARANKA